MSYGYIQLCHNVCHPAIYIFYFYLFSCHREQTSLEDGEIPWLHYHEDIESSTDEENEIGNHYFPPGFFILDGNNNLEDDSSMSEDLEFEWR